MNLSSLFEVDNPRSCLGDARNRCKPLEGIQRCVPPDPVRPIGTDEALGLFETPNRQGGKELRIFLNRSPEDQKRRDIIIPEHREYTLEGTCRLLYSGRA